MYVLGWSYSILLILITRIIIIILQFTIIINNGVGKIHGVGNILYVLRAHDDE